MPQWSCGGRDRSDGSACHRARRPREHAPAPRGRPPAASIAVSSTSIHRLAPPHPSRLRAALTLQRRRSPHRGWRRLRPSSEATRHRRPPAAGTLRPPRAVGPCRVTQARASAAVCTIADSAERPDRGSGNLGVESSVAAPAPGRARPIDRANRPSAACARAGRHPAPQARRIVERIPCPVRRAIGPQSISPSRRGRRARGANHSD
jgi:hypothetical protein